jgi:hypothetical protein
MPDKTCSKCRWLRKYTAENGQWINVCESEDPDYEDVGLWHVATIDLEEFDASYCLNFKEA